MVRGSEGMGKHTDHHETRRYVGSRPFLTLQDSFPRQPLGSNKHDVENMLHLSSEKVYTLT